MTWKEFLGFAIIFLLAIFCLYANDRDICRNRAELYNLDYEFTFSNGCMFKEKKNDWGEISVQNKRNE